MIALDRPTTVSRKAKKNVQRRDEKINLKLIYLMELFPSVQYTLSYLLSVTSTIFKKDRVVTELISIHDVSHVNFL